MKIDLKDKKVIVTAPDNYGQKLIEMITQANGQAYAFPAIETYINPDQSAILNILQNLDNYPFIILPSRMAIDAFFQTYQKRNKQTKLEKTALFAFGKDIEYLKTKYQHSVAFKPDEPGPNGIVNYFKQIKKTDENIVVFAPKVIGVPEPNIIPNFIQNLENTDAKVLKIEAYITRANDLKKYKIPYKLIQESPSDTIIAFTSTAEIMSVLKYFKPKHLNQLQIACFGPYTGNNARKLGLKPVYVGKKYAGFEDFISGIAHL